MKIDESLIGHTAVHSETVAARSEDCGFDGLWATESVTDPFLQSYGAVRATTNAMVGTAIAVAFARNPMDVAYSSWELAGASSGRFVLGLGTQVKPHIERRFSMPWSDPVGRMAEFVDAVRAIWACWQDGAKLEHRGRYYRHDLMSPFFSPERHEHRLPIAVSAVGPKMTHMAGTHCDGVILHPLTNVAYIDSVTLPNLLDGLATSGRSRSDFFVSCPTFMIMGDDEHQLERMRDQTRDRIAFYASTPSYAPILEAIGYEGLHEELRALAKQGQWSTMSSLVDDDVLRHFAIEGRPEEMPTLTKKRYGERVDRTSSYFGWPVDDVDRLQEILAQFD